MIFHVVTPVFDNSKQETFSGHGHKLARACDPLTCIVLPCKGIQTKRTRKTKRNGQTRKGTIIPFPVRSRNSKALSQSTVLPTFFRNLFHCPGVGTSIVK